MNTIQSARPSFADHLLPNEEVAWWDQPQQGLMLQAQDFFLVPFALMWSAFAFSWEAKALDSGEVFSVLWGAPFVLVGLFLILGRFMLDAWLRARTYYALTNRRVLIAREEPWKSFLALNLDQLPETTLKATSRGRGTIRFGYQTQPASANAGFSAWIPALDPVPQFLAIEDSGRVFAAIQEHTARRW